MRRVEGFLDGFLELLLVIIKKLWRLGLILGNCFGFRREKGWNSRNYILIGLWLSFSKIIENIINRGLWVFGKLKGD